jgi:4-coumarate--CoA ligase
MALFFINLHLNNFRIASLGQADETLAVILCSSGTTGASKGVNLSHAHVLGYLKMFNMPQAFRVLSFSPIYWSTGLVSSILAVFRQEDTKIMTSQPFTVELLIELIKKYDITFFQAAPYQLSLLLQSPLLDPRDFVGVQVFCVLGSIVSVNLRKEFRATFPRHPLIIAYGMSESCISISATGPVDKIDGLTVGKISPNIQVKIVDNDGNNLGIGQTGEILAKSEFKFLVRKNFMNRGGGVTS